jgi:hypothetical protein
MSGLAIDPTMPPFPSRKKKKEMSSGEGPRKEIY